jgi:putative salt-induced outer membrane protein
VLAAGFSLALGASGAAAQDTMGAPPPDASAMVSAPKAAGDEPKLDNPADGTTASLSAGGQGSTGNSRLFAATINGTVDTRWQDNGFGAGVLGNYGRGSPPGKPIATTAENVQGRLRYDRYLIDQMSVFLLNTGRHDRFQGIDFRYNLDPGAKYLFLKNAGTSLWVEAGYDLQYDIRRDDALMVMGAMLDKTDLDHSARLFAGAKHAFNDKVTFATGVEFLQSFVHGSHNRLNFDALLAAGLGAGFSVGVGFSARYDHAPLPGKHRLDTATTVSLIFAFSDVGKPPEAPSCPCPAEPPAPPAPVAEPAMAAPATLPAAEAPAATPSSDVAPMDGAPAASPSPAASPDPAATPPAAPP